MGDDLGTGMMVLVFQRLGVMSVSTDSWNSCENIEANSSAQVWRRGPEMLSGPELVLMLVLLNWRVTTSSEMMNNSGEGEVEGEGEGMVARSYVHLDVKSLLSKRVYNLFRSVASGRVLDLALWLALTSLAITLRFLKASPVFMV